MLFGLYESALISANGEYVKELSEELSLTAKNARAIAVRAGEKALGFKWLTSEIEELADNVSLHVKQMNEIIGEAYKTSAKLLHQNTFNELLAQCENNPQITALLQAAEKQLEQDKLNHEATMKRLNKNIDKAQGALRAASVVASTVRVEAVKAEGFERNLLEVADSVDRFSEKIKSHFQKNRKLIAEVNN